jgi:hypothetical protein
MCSWMLVVLPRVAHFVCTKELIPLCSPSTHSDIPVFFFVVLGSSPNLPSSCLLFFLCFTHFLFSIQFGFNLLFTASYFFCLLRLSLLLILEGTLISVLFVISFTSPCVLLPLLISFTRVAFVQLLIVLTSDSVLILYGTLRGQICSSSCPFDILFTMACVLFSSRTCLSFFQVLRVSTSDPLISLCLQVRVSLPVLFFVITSFCLLCLTNIQEDLLYSIIIT